ncbi:hypothetical protein [Sphingomonas oligophenolica]|uniref:Uncharacterized protein n=1 Tax=Sphingomonas oligophenolica TaxID=301154 RepID=A0A502CS37_9SPHN|nr:hypothetical protein [Sphingomonas oligophenolica]TPG15340.1 hypothetical protein EAH84_00555 [Sphingomonas oligophenolica]
MEPLFFVMAIMGCGDGNVQCTQARVVPVRYQSMAQCRAALPYQLAKNTDVDYPMIGAACQRHGAEYAKNAVGTPRS